MLIILCGKTASGKDTIKKRIIDKYGYSSIVTYTTRPIRLEAGEQQDIDYHFITEDEFKQKVKENFFLEYKSYQVADGSTWYYGSPKNEFDPNKNLVIILTLEGYKDFLNEEIPHKSYYIDVDENIIKERLIKRGDDPLEAKRRLLHDNIDFHNADKWADYVVKNNGVRDLDDIVREIVEEGDIV